MQAIMDILAERATHSFMDAASPTCHNSMMSKELGRVLREARRHLDLTQDQVARRTGVSRAAVGQWENGEAPSTDNLLKVCAELGIEVQPALTGKLKHTEGFSAVTQVVQNTDGNTNTIEPTLLERYPFNGESYFLDNKIIPFYPTFAAKDGPYIAVSQNPMFFAPRPEDAPDQNSLYFLGIVKSNLEPDIKSMSMVYADRIYIPRLGDIVLLRLVDAVGAAKKITATQPNPTQAAIFGYLEGYGPGEVTIRQTSPASVWSVPTDRIAAMHRVWAGMA